MKYAHMLKKQNNNNHIYKIKNESKQKLQILIYSFIIMKYIYLSFIK